MVVTHDVHHGMASEAIRALPAGLWMWSTPIERTSPDGSKYHLVLLDTEGIDAYDQVRSQHCNVQMHDILTFGGTAPLALITSGNICVHGSCRRNVLRIPFARACLQTGQYSTQIFSLAVLLSSLFVYNQMGGIDEAALDRLSLVTEVRLQLPDALLSKRQPLGVLWHSSPAVSSPCVCLPSCECHRNMPQPQLPSWLTSSVPVVGVAAQVTKHIRVRAGSAAGESSRAELAAFTPAFLWLLRDFYLSLEEEGREARPLTLSATDCTGPPAPIAVHRLHICVCKATHRCRACAFTCALQL